MRRCDSQLASFHRKMARILQVTETEEKLVHARIRRSRMRHGGFNAARVQRMSRKCSCGEIDAREIHKYEIIAVGTHWRLLLCTSVLIAS